MTNRRTARTKVNGTKSRPSSRPRNRTQRAPLNHDKMKVRLQSLLEKYERAYELVQKKMASCEKDLKLLDEYMKREVKAKEEYDFYAEKYQAILYGNGTKI
jgi:hypothetical protein